MMQKTKGDRRQKKMDGERQGRKTLVGRGKVQSKTPNEVM
jgi:hypothetical protein